MPRRITGRTGLVGLVGLGLTMGTLGAQAAEGGDESIEEIVVTGSYLKRSTEDSPTPLSIVSRADIEELGAIDAKDVINSLTFNSGSISTTNAFSGGDSSTGQASVNLRNLGSGSTLLLLNGKRTVATDFDNTGNGFVDLQGIIPNIAIERVEVVKDGSSALYGSDAVAGVVNFITRDDFEGFEISYDFATDDQTGRQDDNLISLIAGAGNERGNIVISGSFLNRGGLQIADRFDRFGQSGLSTFGQPGRYVALGATTANPNFFNATPDGTFGAGPDPDCNLVAADDGPQGTLGTQLPDGTETGFCIYDFSPFFNLVGEEEQTKVHASGRYAITDNVEFYGEAAYSSNDFIRGNSLFPDVNFAIIGAENPGLQLDSARRGVEPVPYLALQRLLGGSPDSSFEDRPVDSDTTINRNFFRLNAGLIADFDFNGRLWTLDASATRSTRRIASNTRSDTLTSAVDAAYVGLGGSECDAINGTPGSGNRGDGDCFFYNPFQTSVFDPVTGARWDTSDTSLWAGSGTVDGDGDGVIGNSDLTVAQAAQLFQNPVSLIQSLAGEIRNQSRNEQTVFDLVFAGDLFDIGGRTAGLAIGGQYRRDELISDSDQASNNFNFKFVFGQPDFEGSLTTYAAFAEILLPFTDWLEVTVAGRYENFDEIDVDTFDPKLTILAQPTDSLSIRGSVGTSFRVGSLLQLFGNQTSLLNSTDPFSGTGGLAFRPSLTDGNAELQPEEATAFNLGLSYIPQDGPLAGLSFNVDYYNYDYDDIITREAHQALIDADNLSRCPNGPNQDPAAGPLCGAFDSDGDGIAEVISIGPGLPDQVLRDPSGNLLRTSASYLNAQSLDTSGIDMTLGYQFDTDNLGTFRAQLSGSWTIEYDLVDPDGNEIDGVGSRNNANTVGRSLPEFKANFNLGWRYNRHNAVVTVRYIDGFEDDTPQSALRGAFIGFAENIDSFTTVDAQYSIQLPALSFQDEGSVFTVGAKNLFNEDPPLVNTDGGFDPFTHDPRGRIWYGRFTISL